MSPLKYSQTAWGTWERDDNSLPCFALDPATVPPAGPPLCHLLGCGDLALAADHFGRVRLIAPDTVRPRLLSSPDPRRCGAFYLALVTPEDVRPLLASELRTDNQPRVTFGCGYARLEGEMDLGGQSAVAFDLQFLIAPSAGSPITLQASFRHLRGPTVDLTLQVELEVGPVTPPPVTFTAPPPNFCREGIAMFTDVGGGLGDLFLAGGTGWEASCGRSRLCLSRPLRLPQGEAVEWLLQAGLQRDCSLGLLHRQLASARPADIRAAWARVLLHNLPRLPEVWVQDELAWNTAVLHATRTMDRAQRCPVLAPGAALPACESTATGAPVRDLMSLAFAVRERLPDLALATLQSVAAAQGRTGRLPERLGQAPETRLVPHLHRSDLEIWFLLAWCQFASDSTDANRLLDTPLPFADGSREPLWAHLRLAFRLLRDEIGVGAHGHIRILAGDNAPFLDACGREGRGESVLNSAMAVYALGRLALLARRRQDARFAEEVERWSEDLRAAVGRAFDLRWFGRAYTDGGRLLGGLGSGRLFADVQAWAALAACGTARERELALQHTLEDTRTDAGLACLSRPFPLPAPADVTTAALPAGEGGNGGVDVAVCAWVCWALAQGGHRDLAAAEWERFSVRHRAHQFPHIAAPLHWSLPLFASGHAGTRAGGPGCTGGLGDWPLPNAHAVAWQEFALRRIAG